MRTQRYPYLEMPGEDGNVAPACYVTFRASAASSGEIALIDPGSSSTSLTEKVVEELALQRDPDRVVRVSGAAGSQLSWKYTVDVVVFDCVFDQIEVHQTQREYAIIGRDILDRVVVHFDGPRHEIYVDKCD